MGVVRLVLARASGLVLVVVPGRVLEVALEHAPHRAQVVVDLGARPIAQERVRGLVRAVALHYIWMTKNGIF